MKQSYSSPEIEIVAVSMQDIMNGSQEPTYGDVEMDGSSLFDLN